ncbi:MAG: TatD family hydrolase [Opitutales bacterium]
MLTDAHNHAYAGRLEPHREAVEAALSKVGLAVAVVNGTYPGDFEAVRSFCGNRGWALPAYGLHPWRVNDRRADWLDCLRKAVETANHTLAIVEVGPEQWIQDADIDAQIAVFRDEIQLSRDTGLPLCIHCLRAWGPLLAIMQEEKPFPAGFLVHAFAGSTEGMRQLADLGGFFSFSAYIADPRRKTTREAARACPAGRLLLETDAPDMAPPPEVTRWPLGRQDKKRRIHHPAEIATARDVVAEMRGESSASVEDRTTENFRRLFGRDD